MGKAKTNKVVVSNDATTKPKKEPIFDQPKKITVTNVKDIMLPVEPKVEIEFIKDLQLFKKGDKKVVGKSTAISMVNLGNAKFTTQE